MAYNVGYSDKEFKSQRQIREFLKQNGFQTDDLFIIIEDTSYVYNQLKAIEENRSALDFLIDGAVLKIDDLSLRQILGLPKFRGGPSPTNLFPKKRPPLSKMWFGKYPHRQAQPACHS